MHIDSLSFGMIGIYGTQKDHCFYKVEAYIPGIKFSDKNKN